MFELAEFTSITLDHFQTRVELHGEAHVLACDLSMTLKTHNSILDLMDKRLRPRLYMNLSAEEKARLTQQAGQATMDLPISDLPNIAFPDIDYPLKFMKEYSGHTCTIEHGIDSSTAIVLNVCKLKTFRITPIEGGSVEIKFTISSAADIDEHITGAMPMKQKTDIKMKLLAPRDVDGGVIDASADGDAPGTEKAKRGKKKDEGRAATDAFVEQHAA